MSAKKKTDLLRLEHDQRSLAARLAQLEARVARLEAAPAPPALTELQARVARLEQAAARPPSPVPAPAVAEDGGMVLLAGPG